MSDSVHIKGLSDLQKLLDTLPAKIEANIMRGALRAGMNEVKPVAQGSIHSLSGELARGLKVGTRRRGGVVTASLKATGPHRYIAHLVEFGTAAHPISARDGGFLAFNGFFRKVVMHPGSKPKPFLRPALDSEAQNAVVATGQYIRDRLAKKHGLDTAHIVVEGDE